MEEAHFQELRDKEAAIKAGHMQKSREQEEALKASFEKNNVANMLASKSDEPSMKG